MGRYDFTLNTTPGAPMQDAPLPQEVRISLRGGNAVVTTGQKLARFGRVGEPDSRLGPCTHTPIAGEVVKVDEQSVTVRSVPTSAHDEPALDFSTLNRKDLEAALSTRGIDLRPLHRARRLVVNATPPEPDVTITGRLLHDFRDTLSRGLRLARQLVGPTQVSVVGPDVDASAFGNCEVVRPRPRHPNGMSPLVIKAATGREQAQGVTVVDLFQLMDLGRVYETGRPLIETFLTVQGRNMRAWVGTPLRHLLDAAQAVPAPGDRVVLGGPMRGLALADLSGGLRLEDYGLFVIHAGGQTPVRDAACLNCGQCARHCPARLFPGELSMCAEAGLWERARSGHVLACFECGICGYVCPARRPLLQYLQLAKKELELSDAGLESDGPISASPPQNAEEA
ncbi:MAG: electron transporter RnfC [Desulfovibrio sp.]